MQVVSANILPVSCKVS